jgi:serine/threonine protein kinase
VDACDLTGTTVKQYSIAALVGSGGQGCVYRGRDEWRRCPVAIKVAYQSRAEDPRVRRRLATEAHALACLRDPRVARLHDFVTKDDRDFIVMEFVAGATLRDVLSCGPLPAGEVARLGSQIAHGLAAVHAAGIIHCDIKPTNLKVMSTGEVKILDFGLARFVDVLREGVLRTTDANVMGTAAYMAPEQLRGDEVNERTDVFSLGTVLYEMSTGVRAFPQQRPSALREEVLQGQPASADRVNPDVPRALARVIRRAMCKSPEARYQSAADLAAALERLLSRSQPPSRSLLPDHGEAIGTVAVRRSPSSSVTRVAWADRRSRNAGSGQSAPRARTSSASMPIAQ